MRPGGFVDLGHVGPDLMCTGRLNFAAARPVLMCAGRSRDLSATRPALMCIYGFVDSVSAKPALMLAGSFADSTSPLNALMLASGFVVTTLMLIVLNLISQGDRKRNPTHTRGCNKSGPSSDTAWRAHAPQRQQLFHKDLSKIILLTLNTNGRAEPKSRSPTSL